MPFSENTLRAVISGVSLALPGSNSVKMHKKFPIKHFLLRRYYTKKSLDYSYDLDQVK